MGRDYAEAGCGNLGGVHTGGDRGLRMGFGLKLSREVCGFDDAGAGRAIGQAQRIGARIPRPEEFAAPRIRDDDQLAVVTGLVVCERDGIVAYEGE